MDLLKDYCKKLMSLSSRVSISGRRPASVSRSQLTIKRSATLALVSFSFAASLVLASCGKAPWDIGNETDRLAMTQEIKNALTAANCAYAINLSGQLFSSSYSDNNIRMLYSSAHACNVGISLYKLIDDITTSDFTTPDAIFRTLVRLFPSKIATDTRLQSANFAQDALQSIIPDGAVVGAVDRTYPGGYNPGSVLTRDRTDDANIYLAFISMATVGAGLNRYGYNAATDPVTLGYGQQLNLGTPAGQWPDIVTIKGDASHEGCAIASGLLNMFDAITVLASLAPGSTSAALTNIVTQLQAGMTAGATAKCTADGFSAAACSAAITRLRYRDACWEQDPAASAAVGILTTIDSGWL